MTDFSERSFLAKGGTLQKVGQGQYAWVWLATLLGAFLVHVFWLQVVAEDAYISFRFAQNFANGRGLVWNIGEAPVEGYTNFLWVMICVAVSKLGLDLEISTTFLGSLSSLLAIAVCYSWARHFMKLSALYALVPVLLMAASGPLAAWAGSGMETAFFGFLITLGTYLFVGYWYDRPIWWLSACAVCFVAAAMTRPEGVFVFCALGLIGLLMSIGTNRWRHFILPALIFLVLFGGYFLWRYSYFGWLLPNTFYAKTGGGSAQVARGLSHTIWFGTLFVAPLILSLIALIPQGVRSLKQRDAGRLTTWIQSRAAFLVPAYLGLIYSVYIIAVGGDYMAMFRFFAPIVPMIYLFIGGLIGAGLAMTSSWIPRVALAVGTIAILIQSTPIEAKLFPKMWNNHGTWRGIETERWHVNRLTRIGEHFQLLRTSYDDSVATDGIGAIAFVADMKVFGVHGLVDVHIAHKEFDQGELGSGLPGHERGDLDYIFSKRPTYFMFNRRLSEEAFARSPKKMPPLAAKIIETEYELASDYLEDPANGEAGYFTYLRRVSPDE